MSKEEKCVTKARMVSKKNPAVKAQTSLMQNPMFRLPFILFVITLISAFLLGFVNAKTADVIVSNNLIKLNNAMQSVMPDTQTSLVYTPEDSIVTGVYEAQKDGALVGYCITAEPIGYGGAVSLMVGVGLDQKITKIIIIKQTETPGLGAKAGDEPFSGQFVGKSAGITLNGTDDNSIDAMSGATITSRAVTKGVNEALSALAAYLSQGGQSS